MNAILYMLSLYTRQLMYFLGVCIVYLLCFCRRRRRRRPRSHRPLFVCRFSHILYIYVYLHVIVAHIDTESWCS